MMISELKYRGIAGFLFFLHEKTRNIAPIAVLKID